MAYLWTKLKSIIPYSLRTFDHNFYTFSHYLTSLKKKSRDEIRAIQFHRLQHIVDLAYHKTKFYREYYDRHGFHPATLRNPEDILQIPIIRKTDIVNCTADMIVQGTNLHLLGEKATSGSTGQLLRLPVPLKLFKIEGAIAVSYWKHYGFRPSAGRVEFRGSVPAGQSTILFKEARVLRVNHVRLEPEYLDEILVALRSANIPFYHGVPSAIARFAEVLEQTGRANDLAHPKAIFVSSEVLDDFQLAQMNRTFPETAVHNLYGQSECVTTAGWVPGSKRLHFQPGAYYTEFLGEEHEVLGTNLYNDVVPMIRYATHDHVSGINNSDGPLHLFPSIEYVEGRLADRLFSTSGGFIAPSLISYAFRGGKLYTSCKVIQHSLELVEVNFAI